LDIDFDDYADTLLKTWPCENIAEARKSVAMAVKRTRENENEELWTVEVEGRAVGFMLLEFTKIWGHTGEAFEEASLCIDWFDIHPDFQGRGIGRELLQKAEDRGRRKGLKLLFMHTSVHNLAMVNFASRNGFRFDKYLKDFWGEGTGDAFLLTKRL
jgi:ribosomal protein S18 acetylase RimI-like enzyme